MALIETRHWLAGSPDKPRAEQSDDQTDQRAEHGKPKGQIRNYRSVHFHSCF